MPAITGREVQTQHELRCFCSRRPKLAMYGVDANGKLYVHIKIYKQQRVCGEIIARAEVEINCRECLRWHRVRFLQPAEAELEEIPAPEIVPPHPLFMPRGEDDGTDTAG